MARNGLGGFQIKWAEMVSEASKPKKPQKNHRRQKP